MCPSVTLKGNTMTDLHLKEMLVRMQIDARRCYRLYVKRAKFMEIHPEDREARWDCAIWQRRASIAAEHVLELMEIVTR